MTVLVTSAARPIETDLALGLGTGQNARNAHYNTILLQERSPFPLGRSYLHTSSTPATHHVERRYRHVRVERRTASSDRTITDPLGPISARIEHGESATSRPRAQPSTGSKHPPSTPRFPFRLQPETIVGHSSPLLLGTKPSRQGQGDGSTSGAKRPASPQHPPGSPQHSGGSALSTGSEWKQFLNPHPYGSDSEGEGHSRGRHTSAASKSPKSPGSTSQPRQNSSTSRGDAQTAAAAATVTEPEAKRRKGNAGGKPGQKAWNKGVKAFMRSGSGKALDKVTIDMSIQVPQKPVSPQAGASGTIAAGGSHQGEQQAEEKKRKRGPRSGQLAWDRLSRTYFNRPQ